MKTTRLIGCVWKCSNACSLAVLIGRGLDHHFLVSLILQQHLFVSNLCPVLRVTLPLTGSWKMQFEHDSAGNRLRCFLLPGLENTVPGVFSSTIQSCCSVFSLAHKKQRLYHCINGEALFCLLFTLVEPQRDCHTGMSVVRKNQPHRSGMRLPSLLPSQRGI